MNSDRQDRPVQRRSVRRAATVLVGGAIAAGGLAAVAAPAYAQPSGCTSSWQGVVDFTVKCAEGDGLYRAKLTCQKYVWSNGRIFLVTEHRYGAWVAPGPDGSSRAVCTQGWYGQSGVTEFA